jgi:hypothetical protein
MQEPEDLSPRRVLVNQIKHLTCARLSLFPHSRKAVTVGRKHFV